MRAGLLAAMLASASGCGLVLGLEEVVPADLEEAGEAPVVVMVSPLADALDVDPGAPIEITMSTAMDATTVTPDRVVVQSNGRRIGGTVRCEGPKISFVADGRYALSGEVVFTLSADVRAGTGAALGKELTSRFRVRAGRWQQAWKDIAAIDGGSAIDVAANARGETTLVWSQKGKVFAARLLATGDWEDPAEIASGISATSVDSVDVEVDDAGRAIACWIERYDGLDVTTRSVCSVAAAKRGWAGTQLAEVKGQKDGTGKAISALRILLDPATGAGFVSWTETDRTSTMRRTTPVLSRITDEGPSLQLKRIDEPAAANMTHSATSAIGSHGLVWGTTDGGSLFFHDDGVPGPQRTFAKPQDEGEGFLYDLQLGMTANTAVVVTQYDLAYPLHAYVIDDVFDARQTWSAPKKFAGFGASSYIVRRGGPGEILAVWREHNQGVVAAAYRVGGDWQPVESIIPETALHSGLEFGFEVATAADGNRIFVYIDKTDGADTAHYVSYTAASGWSKPQPLPFATPKISVARKVIADGLGRFVVVWREGTRLRVDRFE